ncbi:uncharacterized protein LOC119723407 [Patiria miniata]|uniref:Uncharacterized protein n=1 Tax=Patiria miniata TaxID=46514 RepID=A0A913ZE80_PATMI|nr:uncharacterized protein LOC119723305 [Patiria miniata]XP_038049956.1 uncharacterized protein LOC119723407 [Patiria miniata]
MDNHNQGSFRSLPDCSCANKKALKYRPYYYEDQLLGVCCTNCSQALLEERFLFHPDEDNTRPSVTVNDVVLKKQLKIVTESNTTKIENCKSLSNILKVGDHITWQRRFGHWHHAIVLGEPSN